jgi:hypothetical protein
LVKPTFELHRPRLADAHDDDVADAIERASETIDSGWAIAGNCAVRAARSPQAFIHATRAHP